MPPPIVLNDQELIRLIKKGDRTAFTEVYKRYAESLAGFAASKLYNLDDARDVLHDPLYSNRIWDNGGHQQESVYFHLSVNV